MNTTTNYAAQYYSQAGHQTDGLEKKVLDYPASSLVRFLLLYQHKKNNQEDTETLAKQTAIYLNNHQWNQYQLWLTDQSGDAEELPPSIKEEIIRIPSSELLVQEKNAVEKQQESTANDNFPPSVKEEIIEIPSSELHPETNKIRTDQLPETMALGEHHSSAGEQITENPVSDFSNSPEKIQEELPETISLGEHHSSAGEQIIENPVSGFSNSTEKIQEELPETISLGEHHSSAGEQITENPVPDFSNSPEEIKEELPETMILGEGNSESVFNEKENHFEPVEEDETESIIKEEVIFEPLHTVDYFASQGIKLNEATLANDNLSRQVKSFTAWLKSMKKLHPGQLPEQNEVIEKIIQTSSEASNKDANVLTEAMAEVLVKQGRHEKAKEMYQKLSLINPSKSAYFAAKIESLKLI